MLGLRHFAIGTAVVAMGVALAVPLSPAVLAQQVQKPQGGQQAGKDPAAAQRAYAAGVRAAEKGAEDEAIKQLSVALSSGGLPNGQMAKALYFRGVAYQQQGKSARAISDLTTALWLKNGLAEPDRSKAMEARATAFQAAGLGTPPPISTPVSQQAAAPAQVAPSGPAQPKTTPGALVATAPAQGAFWNFLPNLGLSGSSSAPQAQANTPAQTNSPAAVPQISAPISPAPVAPATVAAAPMAPPSASAASAPVPAATAQAYVPQTYATPAPQAGPQTSSWETSTSAAALPQASLVPAASPDTSAATGGAANPVVGFFSNLFGSGSSSGAQATAQSSSSVVTGSTGATESGSTWTTANSADVVQAAPVTQSGPVAQSAQASPPLQTASVSETLPWASQAPAAATPSVTSAAAGAPAASRPASVSSSPVTAAPVSVAAVAPEAEARRPKREVPVVTGAGAYKLQVAVLKSREEAEQLARTLEGYPGVQSGALRPEVDEQVYGAMGKFYRVRLGPYANAIEPNELCKGLRPQGYDCVVVTR